MEGDFSILSTAAAAQRLRSSAGSTNGCGGNDSCLSPFSSSTGRTSFASANNINPSPPSNEVDQRSNRAEAQTDGYDPAASIPTPQEIESMLAKEMSEMNLDEREKINEEIHCLPDEFDESDPQVVQEHLESLERELKRNKDKPSYRLAVLMNESYVTNPEFRLQFLRADRFNASAAAKRMARFFEKKLEIFGQDRLVRDITQEDLSEEDLDVLRCGRYTVLPKPDRAGRPVLFLRQRIFPSQASIESMVRTLYDEASLKPPPRRST